jgi:tetratricopeptide (TPR) repeat protein
MLAFWSRKTDDHAGAKEWASRALGMSDQARNASPAQKWAWAQQAAEWGAKSGRFGVWSASRYMPHERVPPGRKGITTFSAEADFARALATVTRQNPAFKAYEAGEVFEVITATMKAHGPGTRSEAEWTPVWEKIEAMFEVREDEIWQCRMELARAREKLGTLVNPLPEYGQLIETLQKLPTVFDPPKKLISDLAFELHRLGPPWAAASFLRASLADLNGVELHQKRAELAMTLAAAGDDDGARRELKLALGGMAKTGGAEDGHFLDYARLLRKANDFKGALEAYRTSITMGERELSAVDLSARLGEAAEMAILARVPLTARDLRHRQIEVLKSAGLKPTAAMLSDLAALEKTLGNSANAANATNRANELIDATDVVASPVALAVLKVMGTEGKAMDMYGPDVIAAYLERQVTRRSFQEQIEELRVAVPYVSSLLLRNCQKEDCLRLAYDVLLRWKGTLFSLLGSRQAIERLERDPQHQKDLTALSRLRREEGAAGRRGESITALAAERNKLEIRLAAALDVRTRRDLVSKIDLLSLRAASTRRRYS